MMSGLHDLFSNTFKPMLFWGLLSAIFCTSIGFDVALAQAPSQFILDPPGNDLSSPEEIGKRKAEELYAFRAENSVSRVLTSKFGGVPVELHYRYYSRDLGGDRAGRFGSSQGSKAMIFFPGLRAPEVKHSWVVDELWPHSPLTDFYVLDIRSHGRSESIQKDNWNTVHVESYMEFVHDAALFIKHVSRSRPYEKIVVSAHSTSALVLMLALHEYPEIRPLVDRVVLTSPALHMAPNFIGPINGPGRLPICLAGLVCDAMVALRLTTPEAIAMGYPRTYSLFDPPNVKNMVEDLAFYWAYRRWVKLEMNMGDPYPFLVERVGPSVQFVREMAKAYRHLQSLDFSELGVPIEMFLASKDFLVDNQVSKAICDKIPGCTYTEIQGFHEIPFDHQGVSGPFYASLRGASAPRYAWCQTLFTEKEPWALAGD